jgi:hypothetical protein
MATLAQLESALVKADAAGNKADAQALANEIRRMRAMQEPAAVPAAPAAADAIPIRRGFFERMADVGPSVGLVDVTTPRRLTPEQLERSAREQVATGVGLLAGPALAVGSRAVGAAAPVLQRVTTPLATAFETGGIQSGLTKATPAIARIATRVAGGAVPGAISGAVISPEDATTGAMIGAGGAYLLPPVAQIISKGAGYIADALRGQVATARANQLLRQTIGDEVNALRQAMAAQPDLPASRVAAQLQLPALSALLDKAEQLSPTGVANAFRMRETQDTVNELARLAGGPTAETARAAREKAKESLSGLTGRMREEAFAAARRTGEILPRLSEIASSARESARNAVQRVREFTGMIDSAEEWAKNWVTQSRLVQQADGTFVREYTRRAGEAGVRPPGRYTYPGELAGAAERRAGTAAEESLRAGAQARAAENVAQSMRDRGLEPITTNKFTGTIDRMMSDPDIATNPVLVKALPQIRQMFDDWANQHGVITPEAVYAIRKNVGGVIQNLMPTADAKAQSRMAAQVLRKLKPKIDEAIEAAGGTGFKNYLDSFERGMSDIRGMELAEQIREWYKSGTKANKQKIVDLLAGESPDVVEDFFGSGRYSIAKEMAKDMPLLERIGTALDLDLKAAAQARLGRKPLADIVESQSAKLRFPFFTRASTAVNEVIEAIEKKVGKETMDQIVKAAQSGRDFNVLLDALPTKERNAFLSQFKNAESWSRFSTQVANAARAYTTAQTAEPTPTNALRP